MKKFILAICLVICSYALKAQIYYVNPTATGTNDGSSWANAFTYLQNCLATVNSGEVWVAAGTYYPGVSGSNSATFLMKDNLAIYGGFNGTETLLTQRNPLTNVSILSGDLDFSGTPTALDAYHVVDAGNTGSTALLDGFTITMGYASGTGLDDRGAGLFCAPTVTGVYSPRINRCIFTSNTSVGDGAAIYVNGYQTGGSAASPAITNCKIFNNSASGYGGAAYIGSIYSGASASPSFENCLFYYNYCGLTANHIAAVSGGSGEVYPVFTGCTFYGNASNDEILYQSNGFPGSFTLNNCIVYNIDMYSNVTFTANNTNTNSPYVSGTNNISADPQFVNPAGNDFRLQCFSPGVDLGSVAFTTLINDLDGNPRISNATVDMGAYEGIFSLPVVVANASASTVCQGTSVTLTGSGDPVSYYTWTGGVNDGTPFTPFSTDTYTLTGVDALGCPGTDIITINVNFLPIITANASATTICEGTSITLYGTGGVSYTWDNAVTDNLPFTPVGSNTFNVTGLDVNGCSNMAGVFVQVESSAGFSAGTDRDACRNAPIPVFFNGFPQSATSYTWTTINGTGSFDNPIATPMYYTESPLDLLTDTITLVFSANFNTCGIVNDTILLVNHDAPSFNLGPDYTVCETDSISLQTNVTGGNPPYIYNWSNGLGTISTANFENYLPLVTENINLYLGDMYGCVATDTVLVTVDASEMLTINMHVGASVLTDGTLYVIKFVPQQLAFDTLFPYPFTGGTGTITFNSFPHGNYLLKIVPDTTLFPNLLPTYYGDAYQWDVATTVNHSCTGPFVADINMIALLGGGGTGNISGYIKQGNGFGLRPIFDGDHTMTPGGPLKGIDVKLGRNPGGGIQARTMSNDSGKYVFDNLPVDNYIIYVDIPGLPMDSSYTVSVTATDSVFTNLIYYADSNSVFPILPTAIGIHQYASEYISSFEMYPNPAKNTTNLLYTSEKQNHATVHIMDITGKTIMNIELTHLPKGKHEYQLNFTNQQLQNGIYFVELINENGKQTKKLIIE